MEIHAFTLAAVVVFLAQDPQERTCAECGAAAKEGQKFCGSCGAKIEAPKPRKEVKCPKCGVVGQPGQTFCTDCGASLGPGGITIRDAITLPDTILTLAQQATVSCLQAVSFASREGGGGKSIVTTGTIQQSKTDKSVFTYSASPDDRLRIELADGKVVEFTIRALEGDTSGDIDAFLRGGHRLRYEVVSDADGTLAFSSRRENKMNHGASEASLSGTVKRKNVEYKVSLELKGAHYSESDQSGVESSDEIAMKGTAESKGFTMKISETRKVTAVSAKGTLAQVLTKSQESGWTLDGSEYALAGTIVKMFKENRPSTSEQWKAEGTLTCDGKKIGRYRLHDNQQDFTQGAKIKIFLDLPDEKIELESFDRW